jgi:HSP20 family protein
MGLLKRWEVPTLSNRLSDVFDFDNWLNNDWMGGIQYARVPATNIVETHDAFEIEMAAPGLAKKDFHIDVKDGVLEISVEKEEAEKKETKNYRRREYSYYSFNRSFTLPTTVNADKIIAKYDDGILKVTVPKAEEAKQKPAREIAVS